MSGRGGRVIPGPGVKCRPSIIAKSLGWSCGGRIGLPSAGNFLLPSKFLPLSPESLARAIRDASRQATAPA
jgi:hypothetical protein